MNRICNVLGRRLTNLLLLRPAQRTSATLDKDILLYKYENSRFFRYLNLFGVSQFVFWTYLSDFAHTTAPSSRKSAIRSPVDEESLRDVAVPSSTVADQKWYDKLTFLVENKYKNGMAVLFFLIGKITCPRNSPVSFSHCIVFLGCGMVGLCVGFSRRCVRYLVLHKDGKTVSIVTYNHPLGRNCVREVPIARISTRESRQTMAPYIPMKIKDTKFFYLLDRKGEFLNPVLYDNTVGLNRHF